MSRIIESQSEFKASICLREYQAFESWQTYYNWATGEMVNMVAVDGAVRYYISAIIRLSVISLLFPFNYFVSTRFRSCQIALVKEKDSRAKLVSEVLSGMKVLKLYAMEGDFGDIIAIIRRNEIKCLKSQAILMGGTTIAFASVTFLVAFVSISLVNHLVNMPLCIASNTS
uniref:ABC transmembrane type-1 domain-containing protein n=1 Tax=Tetranychus urticae TaxID=32264 RepID=T1K0Y3_TETUR